MNSIELLQRKMKIYGLSRAKKLEIVTLFEEAKFLHKQEILSAYKEGQRLRFDDNLNFMAEQYYNETYKKD